MKNILVIGSEGSVGKEICKFYKKKKYKIFKVDKISKKEKNYFKIDLSKKRQKKILIKKKIDLAILLSFNLNFRNLKKREYFDEGKKILKNSLSIIELNKIKKIQYFSSFAVYGNNEKKNKENLEVKPKTIYGKLKLIFEKSLINYSKRKNILLQIFRIPNIFGKNFKTSIVYIFKKKKLENEAAFLNNKGTSSRNFIHIKDLCALSLKASKKELSGIYNATFKKNYKIIDIAKHIKCKIKFNHKKFDEPRILKGSSKKAFKNFGWKAQIDIKKIKKF
jgi:nucleoside-diphosphate-sugar epimerase